MKKKKEIESCINHISKRRKEAYNRLDVRTCIYLEGFEDGLCWVLGKNPRTIIKELFFPNRSPKVETT